MATDHVNDISTFSQQASSRRTGEDSLNLFRLEAQIKGVERRLRKTLKCLQEIMQQSIAPETLRLKRRERQRRRTAKLAAGSARPADSGQSVEPVDSSKSGSPAVLEITLNGVCCGHIELPPHEGEKSDPR